MPLSSLTTREAYQVLRDIALGIRTMHRVSGQRWAQRQCGQMTVEVEGWVLAFCIEGGALDHCASCYAPDGRAYVFDSTHRFGTHPMELMSTWEHEQLTRLLAEL
ncbi:hypothetical protein [Pseudomonas sp. KU43P]|uniref:DUF7693 family protein n=1 Tax=Pseudomonas sp. KU43P TaxID=2487887 RepID=UPI0012A79D90|nr:hypothetical protein [Pseudomonas sp. KU43P]BBH46072.1 hypothetical protein KU43P_25490 [Pseudomonas sp. KU43P]